MLPPMSLVRLMEPRPPPARRSPPLPALGEGAGGEGRLSPKQAADAMRELVHATGLVDHLAHLGRTIREELQRHPRRSIGLIRAQVRPLSQLLLERGDVLDIHVRSSIDVLPRW